jgi:hypothetical protein
MCSIWQKTSVGEMTHRGIGRLMTTISIGGPRELHDCWTPCEAYPTILGNLAKAITAAPGGPWDHDRDRARKPVNPADR